MISGNLYSWGKYLSEWRFEKDTPGFPAPDGIFPVTKISDRDGSSLNGKTVKKYLPGQVDIYLDSNGKVHTWGKQKYDYYQEGRGKNNNNNVHVPVCISEISGSPLNGKTITDIIKVYGYNCIALDSDGKVYAWGRGYFGVLGNGTYVDQASPICVSDVDGSVLNGVHIKAITNSGNSIFAIDEEGRVYGWGEVRWNLTGEISSSSNKINKPICLSTLEWSGVKGICIKKFMSVDTGTHLLVDDTGLMYQYCNKESCIFTCYNDLLNGEKIKSVKYNSWNGRNDLCDRKRRCVLCAEIEVVGREKLMYIIQD